MYAIGSNSAKPNVMNLRLAHESQTVMPFESVAKAGHPVTPGAERWCAPIESGGYWIAAFAGDDTRSDAFIPGQPLRRFLVAASIRHVSSSAGLSGIRFGPIQWLVRAIGAMARPGEAAGGLFPLAMRSSTGFDRGCRRVRKGS
jgi:hypothetical protein